MTLQSRRLSRGLSLIELMVAIVIGSILILGVVQVFAASRAAYQLSEGMSRTQENARFAIDYLQHDLRMAGHFGCVNDQSHLQTVGALQPHFAPGADPALNFSTSIQGYEANSTAPTNSVTIGAPAAGWVPALPAKVSQLNPLPGSDIVTLRFLSSQGAPLTGVASVGGSTTFTVPTGRWGALTTEGVANPVLFGVADCSFVDIFRASGVNAGGGQVTTNVAIDRYTAQPSGQTVLYRAESLVYYVGTGASGEPALFRARFNGTDYLTEELVEGVESLQLLYGQDRVTDLTAAQPSGFIDVTATAATIGTAEANWRRVGSVSVGLVMRSPDRSGATAPTAANYVRALGTQFVPSANYDTRYRTAYEANIALRNRLYGN